MTKIVSPPIQNPDAMYIPSSRDEENFYNPNSLEAQNAQLQGRPISPISMGKPENPPPINNPALNALQKVGAFFSTGAKTVWNAQNSTLNLLKQIKNKNPTSYEFIEKLSDVAKNPLIMLLINKYAGKIVGSGLSYFFPGCVENTTRFLIVFCLSNLLQKAPKEAATLSEQWHGALKTIFTPYQEEYEQLCAKIKNEKSLEDLAKLTKQRSDFIKEKIAPDFFDILFGKKLAGEQKADSSASQLLQTIRESVGEEKLAEFFEQVFPLLFLIDLESEHEILKETGCSDKVLNLTEILSSKLVALLLNKLELSQELATPLKEVLSPSLRLVITSLANKLINLDSQTLLKIFTLFKEVVVAAPSVEELQNLEEALTKKLEQIYPEKFDEDFYEDFMDDFIKEQQSLNEFCLDDVTQDELTFLALQKLYDIENERKAQQIVEELFTLVDLHDFTTIGLPPFLVGTAKKELASAIATHFLVAKKDLEILFANFLQKAPEKADTTSKKWHGALQTIFAPHKEKYERLSAAIKKESNPGKLAKLIQKRSTFIKKEIAPTFFKAFFGEEDAQKEKIGSPASPILQILRDHLGQEKLEEIFAEVFPLLFLVDLESEQQILAQNHYSKEIVAGIDRLNQNLVEFLITKFQLPRELTGSLNTLNETLSPSVNLIAVKMINKLSNLDSQTLLKILILFKDAVMATPSLEELQNPEGAAKAKLAQLYPEKSYEEYRQELLSTKTLKEEEIASFALQKLYDKENEIKAGQIVEELLTLINLQDLTTIGLPPSLVAIAKKELTSVIATHFLVVKKELETRFANFLQKAPEEADTISKKWHGALQTIFAPYKKEYEKISAAIKQESNPGSLAELIQKRSALIKEKIAPDFFAILFGKKLEGEEKDGSFANQLLQIIREGIGEEKLAEVFAEVFPLLFLVDLENEQQILAQNYYSQEIVAGIDLLNQDLVELLITKFQLPPELTGSFNTLSEALSPSVKLIVIKIMNKLNKLSNQKALKILTLFTDVVVATPSLEELQHPKKAAEAKLAQLYPEKSYEEYSQELLSAKGLKEEEIASFALQKLYDRENERKAEQIVQELLTLMDLHDFTAIGVPPSLAGIVKETIKEQIAKAIATHFFAVKKDLEALEINPEEHNIAGTALKVSVLKEAISSLLKKEIGKELDVSRVEKNGYCKPVNSLAKLVKKKCEEQNREKPLVPLFLQFVLNLDSEKTLCPLIEKVVQVIDLKSNKDNKSHRLNEKIIDQTITLLQPLVVKLAMQALTPILKKEKEEGKKFDQSLIINIMTILNNHVSNLYDKMQKAATSKDPASLEKISYDKVSMDLLQHFLPKDLQSLQEIFPDLDPELLQSGLASLKETLPELLAGLKDTLFNEEFLKEMTIDIYKSAIESLKIRKAEEKTPSTSKESQEFQKTLAPLLKELVHKGSDAADLSIAKILKIMNYLPGGKSLEDICLKSISRSIEKQLDGEFIAKHLNSALVNLANPKAEQNLQKVKNKDAELRKLEKELVETTISYSVWSKDQQVDAFLSKLDVPVVKQIKNCLVWFVRKVIYRVIGGLLSALGVYRLITYIAVRKLKKNRLKLQGVLPDPNKHEILIKHTLELVAELLKEEKKPPVSSVA